MPSVFSYVGWSTNGQELSVTGDDNSGFWIYELDPAMQIKKSSKVLSGSFAWSSWSRRGTGRLAIDRIHGRSGYRDIWVADLDPNLSAAEALGPARTIKEHYQEMIDLYTRRIEADPEEPENYISYTRIYLDIGDKENALARLDGFVQRAKDPSKVAARYGRLGIELSREEPELAVELLQRAHDMQPENWLYLWGIGGARFLLGQFDEAIARLTESTNLSGGENSLNYFCLAMAHKRQGRRGEAARWYQKGVEQMPTDRTRMDSTLLNALEALHAIASSQLDIKPEEERP